jgi:hypothetical protein
MSPFPGYNVRMMRHARGLVAVIAFAALAAGSAQARSTATVTLAWQGFGDQVGQGKTATPDGVRDGSFTLTVDAPGETVTAMRLNLLRPNLPIGPHEWNTIPLDRRWILGVFRNGTRLNATDDNISDPIGTSSRYDLYAQDDGSIVQGKVFRILVRFASGAEATATATVGDATNAPPPPPPGDDAGDGSAPPSEETGKQPPTSVTLSLASGSKLVTRATLRKGRCARVYARAGARLPAGALLWIERRGQGATWLPAVKLRVPSGTFNACRRAAGTEVFRATVRVSARIVTASKPVTVLWK